MRKTPIEWTGYSANLLKWRLIETGKTVWLCTKVCAGCAHCYAEALAQRFGRGGRFAKQDNKLYAPFFDEKEAGAILRFAQRPPGPQIGGEVPKCRVFVNDMTDTFHEDVPDELLDRIFAVFALCPTMTFQVL